MRPSNIGQLFEQLAEAERISVEQVEQELEAQGNYGQWFQDIADELVVYLQPGVSADFDSETELALETTVREVVDRFMPERDVLAPAQLRTAERT